MTSQESDMTQPEALKLADIFELESDTESLVRRAAAELRRLHAENEALRKDAERYQWLRADRYVDGAGVELAAYTDDLTWKGDDCAHQPIFEDKLDSAIDAAMKGQP